VLERSFGGVLWTVIGLIGSPGSGPAAGRGANCCGSRSSPHNEEHSAREVWCCALWEVFVNLIAEYGHEEAERRMLLYVIGGLKQTPSRPTFTQARDGIIATASGLNPGDLSLVWSGFAKRGMGRNAVSPPSSSGDLVGVVEDFTA
jgi:hypothetical protein